MAEPKTKATEVDPRAYIAALPDANRRADAEVLLALFERVTGEPATMWGPSMIGFGAYDYVYDSGHKGTAMRTGFAPRKANLVLYVLDGCAGDSGEGEPGEANPLLAKLGKHKTGKSCLYINKLADVDMDVVEQLVREGWETMARRYPA